MTLDSPPPASPDGRNGQGGGIAPPISWVCGAPHQRRAWRQYWVDDVVIGLRNACGILATRLLSIEISSALGAALGRLLAPTYPASDARIRKNLALLRPDLPAATREAMRNETWANLGRAMTEFAVLRRLWDSNRVSVHGVENLSAARATGRPHICAAVHLGNWELLGPTLLKLGEDGAEFYQPPRNRFERATAERIRRQFSDRLIPAGDLTAAAQALRALKSGAKGLVLFIDDFSRDQVNGPALGRPLSKDSGLGAVATFAKRAGAVVTPAYILRGEQARFELHILPHLDIVDLPIGEAMAAINGALEPAVLQNLEQWYMLQELRL